jgi:hypothetical protein
LRVIPVRKVLLRMVRFSGFIKESRVRCHGASM